MKWNWSAIGAVGSWAYTVVTGLILVAIGYQISLVRQNYLSAKDPLSTPTDSTLELVGITRLAI